MSADWWQNFANNFAADLAPLISLLGESPTKQYLSETLTFVDVFIFSMAPIGVLTALVSAIRVAGGPSLRAFIGRAQEGAGIAEAELCSSTSRNVCELYTNGGIARVFGRPKILEFVHDWKPDTSLDQQQGRPYDEAGIYSFRDYLSYQYWQDRETRTNAKEPPDEEDGVQPNPYSRKDFAPHPNLSLNVGIKKLPRGVFHLVAILGFVLQSGVLAFAAVVTYKYPDDFRRDDTQIVIPAFPFVCAGTVLLCTGVGMCAFIVATSTYEKTFKRKKDCSSRLYWIQPGDQVVGDQVFDCFAYSDAYDQITEYTTSKREIDRGEDIKQFLDKQSMFVWVATVATTVGFVLQFLGLRTLHSTVSVAQFAAMLVMSAARALLRTRRLEDEHNLLRDSSTLYLNHELDWLAIEMAQENEDNFARGLLSRNRVSKPLWRVTGPDEVTGATTSSKDRASKAYIKRVRLAQMTGAPTRLSTIPINDAWEDSMIASRIWASKLASAIEGTMSTINLRCTMNDNLSQAPISWSLRCCMGTTSNSDPSESTVSLTIAHDSEDTRHDGPWKADRAQLEGVLGLWLWSWISTERIGQLNDKYSPKPSDLRTWRLIFVFRPSGLSDSDSSLKLWFGNHGTPLKLARLTPTLPSSTFNPGSLWENKLNGYEYKQINEADLKSVNSHAVRKIFGSSVVPPNFIDAEEKPFKARYVPSTTSLEMLCVQELFMLFFSTVVRKIHKIKGNTEIVEGPNRFYVVNSTLSEMIDNFTSSGIGSHDDAIACMVPALHSAQKLDHSRSFKAARVAGKEYRQRGEWTRAEKVLLPALKAALQEFEAVRVIPLPGDTESTGEIHVCLLSLCELYRWALLGDKRTRLFGLRGFTKLFKLFADRGKPRPTAKVEIEKIPKDLLSYRDVALSLSRGQTNKDIIQAMQQLEDQLDRRHSDVDGDFHGALHDSDLSGTLSTLDSSILSSCTERPVLAIAARYAWYPIVKSLQELGIDTREVDHNGLNYLHYAAQSCNAAVLKDLIGDDRELLCSKDNFGRIPLHLAAAAGRTTVAMLLAQHFPVRANTRDQFCRSPLDNAILSDRAETFFSLSSLKEDNPEPTPGNRWELETKRLFQAACCGSGKIIVEFLARTIDDNSIERLLSAKNKLVQCKKDFETDGGNNSQKVIKVIEVLTEHKYDPNEWQIEGRTALSFAAEADKVDLVIYLLNKRTKNSIIGADKWGRNPLHHAVIFESSSAVEALIESEYANDLIVKDKDGLDPLEYALRNRSFAIASIILRRDRRGQQLILCGTAISVGVGRTRGYCLCFQGTDSLIRKISLSSSENKPSLCVILPISVRLYTALAVIRYRNVVRYEAFNFWIAHLLTIVEDHIFYVSRENTIGHLRSFNGSERFEEGLLQRQAVKVHPKSSLAALALGPKRPTHYLYYQDEQNCIQEIALRNCKEDLEYISSMVIAVASKGSDIVARSGYKRTPETQSLRSVYFQNRYFEVEHAVIEGHDHLRKPALLTPVLRYNPDLSLISHVCLDPNFIWCDKAGRIYRPQDSIKPHESLNIEDTGGSPTRFAVNPDPYADSLYYQSRLGDIRKRRIATAQDHDTLVYNAKAQPLEGMDTEEAVRLSAESSTMTPSVVLAAQ